VKHVFVTASNPLPASFDNSTGSGQILTAVGHDVAGLAPTPFATSADIIQISTSDGWSVGTRGLWGWRSKVRQFTNTSPD
jgi:hypothetical protein